MTRKTAIEEAMQKEPSTQFVLYESYQQPFDYDGVMRFHRNHQVGNLEWFDDNGSNASGNCCSWSDWANYHLK